MSAATAPDSADHSATDAGSQATQQEANLRIDLTAKSSEDHYAALISVAGAPPTDIPFWPNHAAMPIARGLGPRTIRYISNRSVIFEDWQDLCKIRDAVWQQIDKLLPNGAADDALPSVVLDVSPIPDDANKSVLDLIFATAEAFSNASKHVVMALSPILVTGVRATNDEVHTYTYHCCTNSMSGDFFPFDCLRLPLDSLDGEAVLQALQQVFRPLGSVPGISKVVIGSQRWNVRNQAGGVLRGYVKLSPEWMITPWKEAVAQLPTHWVCNGFPYTLSYPGVDHHEKDVYSRNFTIPLSDPTSQQDVAASSSNKRAPSGTEAQDSSSTAKKKARR